MDLVFFNLTLNIIHIVFYHKNSGHGTFEENGKIFSSLVGMVERTNK